VSPWHGDRPARRRGHRGEALRERGDLGPGGPDGAPRPPRAVDGCGL